MFPILGKILKPFFNPISPSSYFHIFLLSLKTKLFKRVVCAVSFSSPSTCVLPLQLRFPFSYAFLPPATSLDLPLASHTGYKALPPSVLKCFRYFPGINLILICAIPRRAHLYCCHTCELCLSYL